MSSIHQGAQRGEFSSPSDKNVRIGLGEQLMRIRPYGREQTRHEGGACWPHGSESFDGVNYLHDFSFAKSPAFS